METGTSGEGRALQDGGRRIELVALLAWYDEDPQWLRDCILSLPCAGTTALVAVAGGYELFPNARAESSDAEYEAIREAAAEANLELRILTPEEPWQSEVVKRSFMFDEGEEITTEDDWYLIVDADCRFISDVDLKPLLTETTEDVAQVIMVEPHPTNSTTESPKRFLFRALRGLHVEGNHWTYLTRDGRELWGTNKLEPARRFEQVRLEHRTHFRDQRRRERAKDYYRAVTASCMEFPRCYVCGEPTTAVVYTEWQDHPTDPIGPNGQHQWAAIPVGTCAEHYDGFMAETMIFFAKHDQDFRMVANTGQNV